MAQSNALAADASRLASLLLSYIPAVCAFVAPRQPRGSTAIIDRLSHSRALSATMLQIEEQDGAYRALRAYFSVCMHLEGRERALASAQDLSK